MAKLKKPAKRKQKSSPSRETTYATQRPRRDVIQRRLVTRLHRKMRKNAIGQQNLFQNKKGIHLQKLEDAGAKDRNDTHPKSYPETSFLLSTELENMGFTDVNRKIKQEIIITQDDCIDIIERANTDGNPRRIFSVGSQIECTTLKDSDYDFLSGPTTEHVAAISSPNDKKDGRVNILIVKKKWSPQGHVWLKNLAPVLPIPVTKSTMLQFEIRNRVEIQFKLHRANYAFSEEVPDVDKHLLCTWPGTLFIDDRDLKFYIPNSLFTLIGIQEWACNAIRTGPSFSCNILDCVRPIFCDNVYPRDQDPITIGETLYGNLNVPKEHPCNLVPVGHPESEDAMLEWRISFNLTEREIMFGFNITHIQTYVVVKMLQRYYFKRFIGNGFTSFHSKTALFHAVASTEPALWVKSNLIKCVRQCLKMIRIFAKKRFCPHFFNKAFNTFSGKLPRCGEHWDTLIKVADYLIEHPNCYFKCLKEGKKNHFQFQSLTMETQTFVLECTLLVEEVNSLIIYYYDPPTGGHAIHVKLNDIRKMRVSYKQLRRKAQYQMELATSNQQKNCAGVVLSFLKVRHYLLSAAYLLQQGKEVKALVAENILPDALSMELQMSSLLFASGNYELCRLYLDRVFLKTIKDPIFFVQCHDIHRQLLPSDYKEFFIRYHGLLPITDIPVWTFIKRHVSLQVIFNAYEICLINPLLRFEAYRFLFEDTINICTIKDDWKCFIRFESIPFLFFMQYLVYKELGMNDQKHEALVRLEVCIDFSSILYRHIAMNMFGICCECEWNFDRAFRIYKRSLRIRPEFNASKFHIALLVWRFWVKHNVELQACILPNIINIVD